MLQYALLWLKLKEMSLECVNWKNEKEELPEDIKHFFCKEI